ncbi:substrate-binding periplasmic protein [Hahella ganghwensis]|uniref:substrate-binding periplasmic protein n=1 Tax=Hahella ganghwensis TaxID=286420 RepID=UPI0003A8D3FC|nr:ABC transporter substrate-binding protein [Hahella ganghwensis]
MKSIGRRLTLINWVLMALAICFSYTCKADYSDQLSIYTEHYPPYNYEENGQLTGFSTEIVRERLIRLGKPDKEITVLPWARAYKYLQSQDNVMLFTTARTSQREYEFKWVGPIAKREVYLYKLKKNTHIIVHSVEDAKRYMTTAVRDSATASKLISLGFEEGENLELIHSENLSFAKFLYGRVELINKVPMAMAMELKKFNKTMNDVESLFPIDTGTSYYLAFSLGVSDAIIREWQAALDAMMEDGTYQKIRDKYLDK